MAFSKLERRLKIRKRVRGNLKGSLERPRMSVFRSNKHISVQLIDDKNGTTLVASSSCMKDINAVSGSKTEKAALVGKLIAEKALEAGVQSVFFDRNGYLYHGRVKQLADAAREAGLKF